MPTTYRVKYSEDQPRDDHGRFGEGSGGPDSGKLADALVAYTAVGGGGSLGVSGISDEQRAVIHEAVLSAGRNGGTLYRGNYSPTIKEPPAIGSFVRLNDASASADRPIAERAGGVGARSGTATLYEISPEAAAHDLDVNAVIGDRGIDPTEQEHLVSGAFVVTEVSTGAYGETRVTLGRPGKGIKYSPDQLRDETGRWSSDGGDSTNADARAALVLGTTPENYRDTWRPTMTPEEGHAWAKAAGTKYEATVVHVTNQFSVDGLRGQGFDMERFGSGAGQAHEKGAYFALNPDTAEHYTYVGYEALSAAVVLQNPVEVDWSAPEHLDRNDPADRLALEGSFREAVLAAAGVEPKDMPSFGDQYTGSLADSPGGYNYPNAQESTDALKAAGYDSVIIHAQPFDIQGSVGGPQLIVFDKEQAVIIGTEHIPGPENWEYGVEDAAFQRAFAKRLRWRVKEWDESLHPRDDHGRFGEGDSAPGGSFGGAVGAEQLGKLVSNAALEAVKVEGRNPTMSSALKQETVIRTGAAMVQASAHEGQAALRDQLTAAGNRVLELEVLSPGAALAVSNAAEMDKYTVMASRLGFPSPDDVDPREVGARYIADSLQQTWATSSSDNMPTSIAVQMAADRIFATTGERILEDRQESFGRPVFYTDFETASLYEKFGIPAPSTAGSGPMDNGRNTFTVAEMADTLSHSPAVEEYVRQTYAATQEALKSAGITEVTLDRGMAWNGGQTIPTELRADTTSTKVTMAPISSWSTSEQTAEGQFARTREFGAVLTATFPAERIFSIPSTGPGCFGEQEVLVIGGEMTAAVRLTEDLGD